MTTAAHTPGPWFQSGSTILKLLDGGLTEKLATVHGGKFGEPHPNARLIAAAPDMLKSALYIDSVAPCQPGDGSSPLQDDELVEIVITGKALKELRATLAKAKGGNQ